MTKQEISFYDKAQVDALLADKPDADDLAAVAFSGDYDDLTDKPALATVATTGDYDDLIDKPDLSLKLDKVTEAASSSRAYCVDYSGNQTMITIASVAIANTLPLRGVNGVLKVGTPSNDNDAATKKYVDDMNGGNGWTLVSDTDWSQYVDNGALKNDALIMIQYSNEKITMEYPKGTMISSQTTEIGPMSYSQVCYAARLDTDIFTNAASVSFIRNRIFNQATIGDYTKLYFTYGENTQVLNKKTAENLINGISLYIRA